MSYALVTWQPQPGVNESQIASEIKEAITLHNGERPPIELLDRLFLYPSDSRGVGFSTVQSRLLPVVKQNPGLEIIIIMPNPGDVVGGWFDSSQGNFDKVRLIMNTPGSINMPLTL